MTTALEMVNWLTDKTKIKRVNLICFGDLIKYIPGSRVPTSNVR